MAMTKMLKPMCGVVATVAVLTGAVAFAQQPVAIVTDVQGGATYGSAVASPVSILSQLNAGDRVKLTSGARLAMLYYADGAQFDARGPGTVLLDAKRPRGAEGAIVEPRPAAGGAPVRLKSAGLVQGAVVMRNIGLRVVAPDPLVLSTQPELAWTDSRAEATYDVALIDASGTKVFQTTTNTRSVKLPDTVKLAPGQTYALQVAARVRDVGVQSARAEFKVAPDDLRKQAAALAPKSAEAPVAERVAYALWLDQNDLRDEARKWWAGLAQARPEQSGLRERAGAR
jgi:hypothetical protein